LSPPSPEWRSASATGAGFARRQEHDPGRAGAGEDPHQREQQPGAGVEVPWLDDQLHSRIGRELRPRDLLVVRGHDDRDPVQRGQGGRALDRGLHQRPLPRQHRELLREVGAVQRAGEWREALAFAAGEDDHVGERKHRAGRDAPGAPARLQERTM